MKIALRKYILTFYALLAGGYFVAYAAQQPSQTPRKETLEQLLSKDAVKRQFDTSIPAKFKNCLTGSQNDEQVYTEENDDEFARTHFLRGYKKLHFS